MTLGTKDCLLALAATILALSACKGENPDSPSDETSYQTVKIVADRTSVIRNPLTGWALYVGRSWDDTFWASEKYDEMPTSDGTTVRVSDYASIAYMRIPWAKLETSEGVYAWDSPTSSFSKVVKSCLDRGLRMAFRIYPDSRDQALNTPQYVFDAGAEWYSDNGNTVRKSPFPDDPIFQEKYAKFIHAFAQAFDDPDKVDFIDAYGLGKWGEGHTLIYKDNSNKRAVFDWITNLYSSEFKNIALVINYHRLIGDQNTGAWGSVSEDTEPMLRSAIQDKGYSLRHDAFGMTGYYQTWEKNFAAEWNFKRPIIMEGGWVLNTHRWWLDPCGKYVEGQPATLRQGEYDASAEARVNSMDFRTNGEVQSWFGDAFELVQKFVEEGGYRLYPDQVKMPVSAKSGTSVSVTHRWINLGWGYCPTNIPQWNQKYKVGIALLDSSDGVRFEYVDTDTDLSEWLKDKPVTYKTEFTLDGVAAGTYTLALGLVDTTKGNAIGLNVAVKSDSLSKDGWVKVGTVTVK